MRLAKFMRVQKNLRTLSEFYARSAKFTRVQKDLRVFTEFYARSEIFTRAQRILRAFRRIYARSAKFSLQNSRYHQKTDSTIESVLVELSFIQQTHANLTSLLQHHFTQALSESSAPRKGRRCHITETQSLSTSRFVPMFRFQLRSSHFLYMPSKTDSNKRISARFPRAFQSPILQLGAAETRF